MNHFLIRTLNQHHRTCSTGPSNKIIVTTSMLYVIVSTLSLLNRILVALSCVSVWASLFALMVPFNLLPSWLWDWTLPLSPVVIQLIFSSLKLENGLKKHVRSVIEIKYGFVKLAVIFFYFLQDVIMWFLVWDLLNYFSKLYSKQRNESWLLPTCMDDKRL